MLHYPYIAYSDHVNIHPLFKGLEGDPFFVDMSPSSPYFHDIGVRDQQDFQRKLDAAMAGRHMWGVSAYLENRELLLGSTPQFSGEKRFFHLGLDVILPKGTPVHAPLAAVVAESGYWFYHVHFQVLTQVGVDMGFTLKGDCTAAQLTQIDHWCPSPLPLFKKA